MDEGVVEKKKWVHPWKFIKRSKTKWTNDFQNFLRLDATSFDELLKMITPRIETRNTTMRDAIPPSQRLSITLRYRATGNTFEDLKFTSAISPQSIGIIVMETCTA